MSQMFYAVFFAQTAADPANKTAGRFPPVTVFPIQNASSFC